MQRRHLRSLKDVYPSFQPDENIVASTVLLEYVEQTSVQLENASTSGYYWHRCDPYVWYTDLVSKWFTVMLCFLAV